MKSVRRTTSVKVVSNKPFCKVCFDSGKTLEQYSSHFLKDAPGPDGKIICPTLLGLSCLCCNKNGHTVSYCPLTKKIQKEEIMLERRSQYMENQEKGKMMKEKKKSIDKNPFSVLNTSSDKKQKKKRTLKNGDTSVQEVLIVPSSGPSSVPRPNIITYASVLKNPVVISVPVEEEKSNLMLYVVSPKKQKEKVDVPRVRKCWADMDSDDEYF
jgi:hypothetical protein